MKDFLDIQADNFTARLLCPEVIAHFCDVQAAEELRDLFDVSVQATQARWRSLSERRSRGSFRLESEEKILLNQLDSFIARYISEKANGVPDITPPGCRSLSYRI